MCLQNCINRLDQIQDEKKKIQRDGTVFMKISNQEYKLLPNMSESRIHARIFFL